MKRLLKRMSVLAMVTLFCVAFTSYAAAQTSRGKVQGTIKDPNGGVIPGSSVTLTNTERNVSRDTVTNAEGYYAFDAVDPGTYKVSFSAPGFGRLERTDIT